MIVLIMNYWLKRSELAEELDPDATWKTAICLMSMPVYAPFCLTQTNSLGGRRIYKNKNIYIYIYIYISIYIYIYT